MSEENIFIVFMVKKSSQNFRLKQMFQTLEVLYHHEHADGTGPFQKTWREIPLFARIIHLADMIDIIGNSKDFNGQRWNFICQYLSKNKDRLFDSECVNAFRHAFTKESFMCLSDDSFETNL